MRPDIVAISIFCLLQSGDAFQPVKISVRRSENTLASTTEDPDAYNSYDPFDLEDSPFFSDISNTSKRLKLQLETAQFIQKFGAQELLNIILRKVQNTQLPRDSKGAINDFLDFVEDLIYSNAANRIEKKLKMDLTENTPKRKLHIGEARIQKAKVEYGDSKDHRRRDAPALAQNAVLIEEDENYPAVRQPLEPTKLMFFTHNEPSFLREEAAVKQLKQNREIRRSPMKLRKRRRLTKAQLEKAIIIAERESQVAEMEKILKKRRAQRKEQQKRKREREQAMKRRMGMKKLPITKMDDMEMRRSPVPGGHLSFNEKMFQLLDEYGIKSFRVETADYTVRAFANPEKTRFSSINLLDVPEYNDAIRRKPARPPFVYSRTIQAPKRNMLLRRSPMKKSLQKRRSRMSLERLL